jgi:hypothetical protein
MTELIEMLVDTLKRSSLVWQHLSVSAADGTACVNVRCDASASGCPIPTEAT